MVLAVLQASLVFITDFQPAPRKGDADNGAALRIKLFSGQFGIQQQVSRLAAHAKNLGNHRHHVPAGGAGQVVIHTPAIGAEILGNAGIDAADFKIQSSVGQSL